jgi:hypothetical protein
MTFTKIEKNPAIKAMRALVLRALPSLVWRHHGIGCLQAYLVEDCEPEVRVHLWSPLLVKPGIQDSGDAHDHRFNMRSHVVAGVVGHTEMDAEENACGAWTSAECVNARAAGADNNYDGEVKPLGTQYSVREYRYRIREGLSYWFPHTIFHRSVLQGDAVAVTVVEKHTPHKETYGVIGPARILHPVDRPLVHAFGHDMDVALASRVVEEARAALALPFRTEE